MQLGIIGLPNVGKSTLFNALTKAGAEAASYPYSTIRPNVGIVTVPDGRLTRLSAMYKPKKTTPATVRFVDIAGLAKGASRGEGLGNQFLSHIRDVDALVHVVRCFEDENIVHPGGNIDPRRDIEDIDIELIFADLEVVERRIARVAKAAKSDKSLTKEAGLLAALKEQLENGGAARDYVVADEEEAAILREIGLLTSKPVIFAANAGLEDISDGGADGGHVAQVRENAARSGSEVFVICAQIEQEIAELDDDEREQFISELGIRESGLDQLIRTGYQLLGLMSFFTVGEDEVRAWTVRAGTKAAQAAGKIHSDLERGFIRAEVVAEEDLLACGSWAAAKDKGLLGIEGKEYVVRDGDVLLVRFNV